MKQKRINNPKKKAIIFDLDETLLDEKKYRTYLFQKLEKYTEYRNKEFNTKKIRNYSLIKDKIYKFKVLDYFKKNFLKNDSLVLIKLIYFSSTKIPLFKNTLKVLNKLKNKYLLLMITDGNELHQFNKIYLSGLLKYIQPKNIIINSKKKYMKPSTYSYKKLISLNHLNPKNTFYVGDNPKKDFSGAKKLGLKTIRIIKGKNKGIKKNKYIDFQIKNLNQLDMLIKKIK